MRCSKHSAIALEASCQNLPTHLNGHYREWKTRAQNVSGRNTWKIQRRRINCLSPARCHTKFFFELRGVRAPVSLARMARLAFPDHQQGQRRSIAEFSKAQMNLALKACTRTSGRQSMGRVLTHAMPERAQ